MIPRQLLKENLTWENVAAEIAALIESEPIDAVAIISLAQSQGHYSADLMADITDVTGYVRNRHFLFSSQARIALYLRNSTIQILEVICLGPGESLPIT